MSFQHGRQLTAGERDELRHLLQVLMENVRTVRNTVEPQTGALGLSVGQWTAQWSDLTKHVDYFTGQLPPPGTETPARTWLHDGNEEPGGAAG